MKPTGRNCLSSRPSQQLMRAVAGLVYDNPDLSRHAEDLAAWQRLGVSPSPASPLETLIFILEKRVYGEELIRNRRGSACSRRETDYNHPRYGRRCSPLSHFLAREVYLALWNWSTIMYGRKTHLLQPPRQLAALTLGVARCVCDLALPDPLDRSLYLIEVL